jgi:hypothetical protein
MKSSRKALAAAGAAIGAIAVVLTAALPASASTQRGGGNASFESIDGFLAGPGALSNSPVVRLQLSGAVNARGSINLGGNAMVSPIPTFAGTLAVAHGNPRPSVRVNYMTCQETSTISTPYTVLGRLSSGAFSGAQGDGRALVVFSAVLPRYTFGPHRGRCNFMARPEPFGASISFHAQGPLFLRHR